ncbi:hypothetical protein [Desmospora profundinema]|uniref:Uncharacterized protein n=1 Tax=Desmospora profundinema TaxID=1571184 RepID=A0ABU1IKL3_9BACL|nr:hypothetical protein [Desmospora profundinema]MDR6224350.1 hypothetical protein [Desmospora profundinema]
MAKDPSKNRRELHRPSGMRLKDPLEIHVDGDYLFIRNSDTECIVCGGTESVQDWKGRRICATCIDLPEK